MAKTKDIKLPKYLKLVKGIMWMDIEGDSASGIRLYRTTERFVGRGNNLENKEKLSVSKDAHSNLSSRDGEYGWVDTGEDKSYFCTTDVPPEKLQRILTAYQSGILAAHNPRKPEPEEVTDRKQKREFEINRDGDVVFVGKNEEMYKKLNTLSFAKLQKFIEDCNEGSYQNLMDMYEYETKGYNKLSRPRLEVIDLLRKKLRGFGPRMTPIRVNEDED